MNSKETDRIIILEVQMGNFEKALEEVKNDVKEILTNHLPHLSNQIAVLTVKVAIGAGVASLIGGAIVGWLFR